MNRYALDSYPAAESRIRSNGFIFDVGQISPSVLSQLYAGASLGLIKISRDSWPFRGLTIEPGVEVRTVFEMVRKDPLDAESAAGALWNAAYSRVYSEAV